MVDPKVLMDYLVPVLPFLYKASDKMLDGALDKVGEDGWDLAKKLWSKLWPPVAAEPVAVAAIDGVLLEPENSDRQVVLKMALQDLLQKNPQLAQELADLLRTAQPQPTVSVTIKSKGNNNVNTGINNGVIFGK
jgi:hypothetical protein